RCLHPPAPERCCCAAACHLTPTNGWPAALCNACFCLSELNGRTEEGPRHSRLGARAFQGCAPPSHLVQLDVNTLILCGNSTSGCVRATAVNAFSAGHRAAVVEECVFDRNWLSHNVDLLDLNCKYAV